jgi:hypothetical protein
MVCFLFTVMSFCDSFVFCLFWFVYKFCITNPLDNYKMITYKCKLTVYEVFAPVDLLGICDMILGLGSGVEKVLILSYSMLIFLTSFLIFDLFQIGDVVINLKLTVFARLGSLLNRVKNQIHSLS